MSFAKSAIYTHIRGFTLGRNPSNAWSVDRASLRVRAYFHIKRLTLGRNRTNAWSVSRALPRAEVCAHTTGWTPERSPIHSWKEFLNNPGCPSRKKI
uniref:Uncharacterized protein n=1 Tax=Anolis carolinensis TaxID=28377 RepID=A0A803SQ25_ANOCA